MAKYSLVKSSTVEQIAPLEVQVVGTSEVTTESIHAKRRHPDQQTGQRHKLTTSGVERSWAGEESKKPRVIHDMTVDTSPVLEYLVNTVDL